MQNKLTNEGKEITEEIQYITSPFPLSIQLTL